MKGKLSSSKLLKKSIKKVETEPVADDKDKSAKSTKSSRSLKSLLSRKSNKSSAEPIAEEPVEDTEAEEAAAEEPEAEKSSEEAGADDEQLATEEELSVSVARSTSLQAEEPEAEKSSEEAGADDEQVAAVEEQPSSEERAPSPTESLGSGKPADASVSPSLAESVARSIKDFAEDVGNIVAGQCLGRAPAVTKCEKPEEEIPVFYVQST